MRRLPSLPVLKGLRRNSASAAVLLATALLAGCASVPPSTTDTPVKPASLATAETFKGQGGVWPAQEWWKGFNDPQLNALMDEAFKGSPDLKAAQARVKKAQAFYDQVKAVTLPDATLNLDSHEMKQSLNMGTPDSVPGFPGFSPKVILPQGYQNLTRLSVDADYDIDVWGKAHAALRGAIGQSQAARLEAEVARQSLAQQIANAYVELDRLYTEREDLGEIKQGADIRVQLVQARIDHNLDTLDTLVRAQDDQAQAAQRLSALDGAIRVQGDLIAALMGEGPDRALQLTRPHLAPEGIDALPDDLNLNLLGRRPDVIAARLHIEAASDQIKYTAADFYPDIKLNAYLGVEALSKGGFDQLFRDGSDIGSIGPAISLPLFKGGRLRAAYRSSEADYDQAVATYDQTLTKAFQDVADAAAKSQSTADQLKASDIRVHSAQVTYDLSKARFGKGLGTKIDVLQAHAALIAAQLDQSNLKAQAYTDRIHFIAALGGGFQSQ
jgi:NodT family efflux transporter outer membrane factor (OMF) lipoprotein